MAGGWGGGGSVWGFGVLTGEGGGERGRDGKGCTVGLLDELRSFDRLKRERERKHGVFSCDLLYRLAIWGKRGYKDRGLPRSMTGLDNTLLSP